MLQNYKKKRIRQSLFSSSCVALVQNDIFIFSMHHFLKFILSICALDECKMGAAVAKK